MPLSPLSAPPLMPKARTIVLWLVFFFPAGLWLLWRDPRPSLKIKQYVTGAIAVIVICGGLYQLSPQGRADQTAEDKASAQQAAEYSREQAAREATEKAQHAAAENKEVTYAQDFNALGQFMVQQVPYVTEVSRYDKNSPDVMIVTVRGDKSDYQSREDAISAYRFLAKIRTMAKIDGPTDCVVVVQDDTGKTLATANALGAKN